MKKFTKNSSLKEVLQDEKNREILEKYKIPCLGCPFARFEMENLTLEKVCGIYKIDLNKLLEDLNKSL